eukprot:m.131103 g.131103  ORF g.131103 m.131103 type:complete len:291 (+) comp22405_c0_seq1:231-1103(+)
MSGITQWVGPVPSWAGPISMWQSEAFPLNETLSVPTRHSTEYAAFCSPMVLVGSSVAYLVLIKILSTLMANREAFVCREIMILYNLVQIALCGYMTIGITTLLMTEAPVWEPIEGIRVPNIFGFNMQITKQGEYFIFIHYLSKILDLLDTVFICLKKKDRQLIFLHVYHHATIGQIWGFLLYIGWGSGTALFGANINSFVHVVMYTHYLFGALKINNPFKKYITYVQICQFYLCVGHATVTTLGLYERIFPRMLAVLQLGYHITMIYLFTNFLRTSYKDKKASEKAKKSS